MDIDDVVKLLPTVGPFSDLTPEETARVVAAGEEREARAGDVLITEGDTSHEMFVFLEGRAEVSKIDPARDKEIKLGEVETGNVVGELSMLHTDRRMATVRAVTRCRLFVLDRAAFDALVADGDLAAHKIGLQLARLVCDRMSLLHDKVMDYLGNDASPRRQEFASFKQELMSNWDF